MENEVRMFLFVFLMTCLSSLPPEKLSFPLLLFFLSEDSRVGCLDSRVFLEIVKIQRLASS